MMKSRKILIVGPCAAESAVQMQTVARSIADVLQSDSAASFQPVFSAASTGFELDESVFCEVLQPVSVRHPAVIRKIIKNRDINLFIL